MLDKIIEQIRAWANSNPEIESVIVVGSYARGTQNAGSDLDLCIVTTNKAEMLAQQDFVTCFGVVTKKQTERYGACSSVRVWYESGLEIEFGLVDPSWIAAPLDTGTRKVLAHGYIVVVDKMDSFSSLEIKPITDFGKFTMHLK